MKCPECRGNKARKDFNTMEIRVAGNVLTVCVCSGCRENFSKIMGYASAFPTATPAATRPAKAQARQTRSPARAGAARNRADQPRFPHRDDSKFDRYALSEAEIKQTQALRPTVRTPDSPRKRQVDDIDKINTGERCRVFCMAASPKMRAGREKKIMAEAMAKLRTSSIKMVKDDGFEAVFEAA